MKTIVVVVCAGLGPAQDIGTVLGNEELHRRPAAHEQMAYDVSHSTPGAWASPHCHQEERSVASSD
jgi:hypothetical protein